MLRLPTAVLQQSSDWADVLGRWSSSPSVASLLQSAKDLSMPALSRALLAALMHLVKLAGGWVTRPRDRRPAYESNEVRLLRRRLQSLHSLESLLQSAFPSQDAGLSSGHRLWITCSLWGSPSRVAPQQPCWQPVVNTLSNAGTSWVWQCSACERREQPAGEKGSHCCGRIDQG